MALLLIVATAHWIALCSAAPSTPFVLQHHDAFLPDGECSLELFQLGGEIREVVENPNLSGQWISTQCEILPGPTYVLRDYQFYGSTNFLLKQYRYQDPECRRPKDCVVVEGTLRHMAPIWAVPGATETGVDLSTVKVVPYSESEAKLITEKLTSSCPLSASPDFQWPTFEPFQQIEVFRSVGSRDSNLPIGYVDDIDCLHSINYSTTELMLMRMDDVKPVDLSYFVKRLFFGVPVWDTKAGAEKMPSHFQPALVNAAEVVDCKTCQRVVNAHILNPPQLRAESTLAGPTGSLLQGDWLSTECESHVHGLYVMRQMSFSDNGTFGIRVRHFEDALCRRRSHTITASGPFVVSGLHQSPIPGAAVISYSVESVAITPESRSTSTSLRYASNCGNGLVKWRKGHTVDLTESGGCAPLGIAVPSLLNDIVLLDKDAFGVLLRTGDFASVEYTGVALPTSTRPPLRQCQSPSVKISLIKDTKPSRPSSRTFYHMWQRSSGTHLHYSSRMYILSLLSFVTLWYFSTALLRDIVYFF